MGLNVLFSFGFSALFRTIGWLPHGGLALANSLATAIEVTALFFILRVRLNGINERFILRGGFQSLGATLAMSLVVLLSMRIFSGSSAWLLTLSGILPGGLDYALAVAAMRVPEWEALVNLFRRRVKISENRSNRT